MNSERVVNSAKSMKNLAIGRPQNHQSTLDNMVMALKVSFN